MAFSATESIKKYYDPLSGLNPVFNDFKQVHKDNLVELDDCGINTKEYDKRQSLIFEGFTEPQIRYESGAPKVFVKYHIVFKVGEYLGKPLAPYYDNSKSQSSLLLIDYQKCKFFENFFVQSLNSIDIHYGPCEHTHKCKDFVAATGSWCFHCFGYINNASNFIHIIHKSLHFSDIPKDSIYLIQEILQPIDMTDHETLLKIKSTMETDQKEMVGLENSVVTGSQSIKKYLEEQITQMKTDQIKFNTMLKHRNVDSVKAFTEQLSVIDQHIQSCEKAERIAKIKQDRIGLLEKNQKEKLKLDMQIADLDTELHQLTGDNNDDHLTPTSEKIHAYEEDFLSIFKTACKYRQQIMEASSPKSI